MFTALLLLASLHPQIAPPKPGVIIWPHGVSPLGIEHKENFGNHGLSITVHNQSGIAEIHHATATVMVVQSGDATLIYGGDVIDPHTIAPNEIRGSGIRNGTRVHVSAGDVIHFAAGVPHQWLIAPGHHITYLVVHIDDSSPRTSP
jgi:uncharacterized RmlC-like cupin family protein